MLDKETLITLLLIIATSFLSLYVILCSDLLIILLLSSIIFTIALLTKIDVKSILKFTLFFQGFFILSSIITQAIVFGNIIYESLVLSNMKIFTFILLSFVFAKNISTTGLIKLFKKISINLAVAIALSVKFMRISPVIWSLAYRTYGINYSSSSKINRIKILLMTVKAFINLSLYLALQTAESLVTRSVIIFGEKE